MAKKAWKERNKKKAEEAKLLSAIERKYGVDRHILLGIWGMESNFGRFTGTRPTVIPQPT